MIVFATPRPSLRRMSRAFTPPLGEGRAGGSVFAGFEKAPAGVTFALHRHHLAAEERNDLGIGRTTEGAARRGSRSGLIHRPACTAFPQAPAACRGAPGRCRPSGFAGGSVPSYPNRWRPAVHHRRAAPPAAAAG